LWEIIRPWSLTPQLVDRWSIIEVEVDSGVFQLLLDHAYHRKRSILKRFLGGPGNDPTDRGSAWPYL
jgi:hypothetical protein